MYIKASPQARPLPPPEQKAQPLLTAHLSKLRPLVEVPPVQYLDGVLSGSVHLALVEVARRRPLVPAIGPRASALRLMALHLKLTNSLKEDYKKDLGLCADP